MRKKILALILIVFTMLCLCSCSSKKSSTFSILFIDVGQGDAALIECDGRYMLIDGGDLTAGDRVYNVLEEKGIQHLDILVMSHLHADHIGGLVKALTYASRIDTTLCNTDFAKTETFRKVEHELGINEAKILIPHVGEKFTLGSAEIEVVDVASEEDNDSLVILITYGKTRFLFTGDIEETAQKRIAEKYANESDEPYNIDLIKMPHHGSDKSEDNNFDDSTGSLYVFLRTFMPKYAVISVGEGNKYGHPGERTLSELNDLEAKIYRTDIDGDIVVKSDGKELSITTSR